MCKYQGCHYICPRKQQDGKLYSVSLCRTEMANAFVTDCGRSKTRTTRCHLRSTQPCRWQPSSLRRWLGRDKLFDCRVKGCRRSKLLRLYPLARQLRPHVSDPNNRAVCYASLCVCTWFHSTCTRREQWYVAHRDAYWGSQPASKREEFASWYRLQRTRGMR